MYSTVLLPLDSHPARALKDCAEINPFIFSVDDVVSKCGMKAVLMKCSDLVERMLASKSEYIDNWSLYYQDECLELVGTLRETKQLLTKSLPLNADPPSGALGLVRGWKDMSNSGVLLETVEALDLAVKEGSSLLSENFDEVQGRANTCNDSAFEAAFVFAQTVAASFICLELAIEAFTSPRKDSLLWAQPNTFLSYFKSMENGPEGPVFAEGKEEIFGVWKAGFAPHRDTKQPIDRARSRAAADYRFVLASLNSKFSKRLARSNAYRNKLIGFCASFAMVILDFLNRRISPILFAGAMQATEEYAQSVGLNISLT